MAKQTGGNLNFIMGATVVAAMRGWTYEETDVDTDSTAAGDTWMDRDSLRGDYTVEADLILTHTAGTYHAPWNGLRGTKAAWSAELQPADTNGLISGVGKYNRVRVHGTHDGMFLVNVLIGAAGTGPTVDLTPA
jgi:hypothetical protein